MSMIKAFGIYELRWTVETPRNDTKSINQRLSLSLSIK